MLTRNRTNTVLTLVIVALAVIATASPSFAVTITTLNGNGADASVLGEISAGDTNFGLDTVLNAQDFTATSSWLTFLRFDISGASGTFTSATLQLTSADEGFGAAGTTFEIHGLKNSEIADAWVEGDGGTGDSPVGEIDYNNAPGLTFVGLGSDDVDPTKTDLLGTAVQTANGVTINFSNAALLTFLNADTDGLVTFMVSDDGAGAPGALQWASKEHATLAAPTLTFEVAVPEPGTLTLLSAGLLGLLFCGRRRKRYRSADSRHINTSTGRDPMNTRKKTNNVLTLAAVAFAVIATASPSFAATVTHLGNEINFGDGWRSTDEAKTNAAFDPNGDDAWGTDGYYVAVHAGGFVKGAPLSSLPTYIDTVTDTAATATNGVAYDNPSLAIGPSVTDRTDLFFSNNISAAQLPVAFDITLDTAATFVVTVIYDNFASLDSYDTDEIEVSGPGGAFAETTGLTANGTVDYAFFRITGDAADVFTVTMVGDGISGTMAAGIAFEAAAAVPEPGTLALLSAGLLGLLYCGRRRRR